VGGESEIAKAMRLWGDAGMPPRSPDPPDVRPRWIHRQVTVLVTLLAILLLAPIGMAGATVAGRTGMRDVWPQIEEQARDTAGDVRAGRLTLPIRPDVPGVDLVQVITPRRHVVAASPAARGLPPLLVTPPPTALAPRQDVLSCARPLRPCEPVSAVRVEPGARSDVVYAGRSPARAPSTGAIDALFILQVFGLVLAAVWSSWKISTRVVRPVDTIREELTAIENEGPSARLPEPPGDDEIARLAHVINGTLTRLEAAERQNEHALDRQREFAADASHELRTPVAGLRLRLEEARLYPEDSELTEVVKDALSDLDRLESILTDLLLLARLETDATRAVGPVNLTELATCAAAQSERSGRLPVRLAVDPAVTVDGVSGQLARALSNLLDNAQRHAEHVVTVALGHDAHTAELTVTDDGAGIPAHEREHVFERFARLDTARGRKHGGTGLGLAIAREIARAHGGTLEACDAPSGGARFVLRLPRFRSGERTSAAVSNREPGRTDFAVAGRPASGADYR
jgi:signal transduction histidine kinase